ncbi:hypothetical protein MBANPS3_009908 [Mucor bainieri]
MEEKQTTPFHNHQLHRRDVTTVYQPTTVYETVVASALEGVYRKTRKIYKHRHEVIKQDRQQFEDDLEQLNQQLDPYREYTPGQAAKYRQDVDEESEDRKSDTEDNSSYDDQEDDGHCKEGDEWCCEEGEEGCDENEYEECNEGEEGCEEYDPEEELILREVDFDIYIVDVDEYVGTTIESPGEIAFTLFNGTTVSGGLELATTAL